MYEPIYVEEKSDKYINKLPIGSRLFDENIIYVFGDVTDEMSYSLIQQLQILSARDPKKDITLLINSRGGSVSAGLAIYSIMKSIPNDISTICVGVAASMGAFLFSGGTKGKRFLYKLSQILIHQPLGECGGQASQIEIEAKHINWLKQEINKELAKNTGKTLKQIYKDTDRDYWMSADDAVSYGIADKIIK